MYETLIHRRVWMKIVNLTEFLALPNETLFSKYEPCVFENMAIKTDNCNERDFIVQYIADSIKCTGSDDFGYILEDAEENGTSIEIDLDICGRDGCFNDDQLFAVWERQDVIKLIERLQKCIN
jgi:hypothetical protein